MYTDTPEAAPANTNEMSRLVYAQVDEHTLAVLDRLGDEQTTPRSWLIAQILQNWAAQHDQGHTEALAA